MSVDYSTDCVESSRLHSTPSSSDRMTHHEALIRLLEGVRRHGSSELVAQHIRRGKLLARDRIARLVDRERDGGRSSFFELSALAGHGLYPDIDIPSAGIVTGIGKIHNVRTMIIANDATVKGGTLFPITVKKQVRAMEIAYNLRLPCVYLVDSGGAFLPMQSEIFPDKNMGGRSFFLQARMSSEAIPQIAAVLGSCTAGGAYIPAMCDETFICNKTGTIFLGGPPLVKAATGEEVTAEELGGALIHCETSGLTDHFVESDEEALEGIRTSISFLEAEREYNLDDVGADERGGSTHSLLAPELRNLEEGTPARTVLEILSLPGSFHEFKSRYGGEASKAMITGTGKVPVGSEGRKRRLASVGFLALDPTREGGGLRAADAVKACQFIQACNQRGYPLVFLLRGGKWSPNGGHEVIKAAANLATAVACASVPKITFVMGRCERDTVWLPLGSRGMEPTFIFSWPEGDLAVQGQEAEKVRDSAKDDFPALRLTARLYDDGVIDPARTREVLAECLGAIAQSKRAHVSPLEVHYRATHEASGRRNSGIYRF